MSVDAPSCEDRRRAFESVNRLLADGRLTLDEVINGLDEHGLQLLQQSIDEDASYPLATYVQLSELVKRAEDRARHEVIREGRPPQLPPPRLSPHREVPHEVSTASVALVGLESVRALEIFELVEAASQQAVDTRVEIGRVRSIDLLPQAAADGDCGVAILDLAGEDTPGLEVLARPEISQCSVPVVLLIDHGDEDALLHMGWRDYIVVSQLTPLLLVRTLRHCVERHALECELEIVRGRERFHATRDHMTELPNRSHFHAELQRALDRAGRGTDQVAVLFVDLDRFKHINDTFGHEVGDCLITTMAARLSSVLRRTDLVARVGGDEFVLMLQDSDLDFAPAVVAAKILDVVAQPFMIEDEEHSVSASVGIAVFPRDGGDPGALIRNADAAMYQAKATGRNSYQFYSQSMNAVARRRVKVESKLRRAVENDELELYYQPRVDANTWHISSAEALLRWSDPDLGIISPVEFVPIAEDSGLIVPIGQWVLHAACVQQARWRDAGHSDVRVSVNLSSQQIREDTLRQAVVAALWDQDVDPRMLEVEITETALIENQEIAASVLTELLEMGVQVSLDDFGTGFSSLSYLKRFPVNTIKIDQSFVRDILIDRDDASITEAIISIAEKLQLRVVAEGVETRGQRDFLASRGCHEMQGYYFSPPVPADAFLRLIQEGPLTG